LKPELKNNSQKEVLQIMNVWINHAWDNYL